MKRIFSRRILLILLAMSLTFSTMVFCSSCNVTRTVTTKSEYFQKGDTSCTIVTKTIESYDATKKAGF